MADPDPQIREGGKGGGGGGHPYPEIRGARSIKKISALWASSWSKNKGGGGGVGWIRHWSDRSDYLKKRPIQSTLP